MANKLIAEGVSSFGYEGDPISVWCNELYPKIVERPVLINGFTRGEHAFVLSEIAQDFGYGLADSDRCGCS